MDETREPSCDTSGRIGVVTEVHGMQHCVAIVVVLVIDPEGCFQGIDDMPRGFDLLFAPCKKTIGMQAGKHLTLRGWQVELVRENLMCKENCLSKR